MRFITFLFFASRSFVFDTSDVKLDRRACQFTFPTELE